jgi:hypothetical protein
VAIVANVTYLSAVRARLFLPALLFAPPLSLAAQVADATPGERRASRRTVLAILGTIVGGAGGAFFQRQTAEGACQGCYVAAGAVIGGVAGFFVGRELDQMHEVRFRGVPRMRIPFDEQTLDGDPLALTARDTLVAVATTTGVTILSSTADLRALARRANGIRGISALDLTSRTHALAVATPTGLYLYPPMRGPGVLLREGTIQAASASDDHVFFAIGPRVEWAPVSADSARPWHGFDLEAPVADLEWDNARRIVWVLADTNLVALAWNGDSARITSRTRVDAGGRSLALHGDRLGIVLGSGGVAILDVHDPAAPLELARWTGTRFVYDAALTGDRLYAGAGPEGVFVIDVSTVPLRTIGLAFDLGFAASLLSRDGYTYILDRRTSSVRRISTPTTR